MPKLPNIPVTMDQAMVEEIDAIATQRKESRSAVLRSAIRAGLPLLKSGGAADVLTLDSEVSKTVDAEAERGKRTRNSIILEAIRHGIRAVEVYAMIKQAAETQGMEDGTAQFILRSHEQDTFPEKRAAKIAMLERAVFWEQVWDLVTKVPEARKRKELVEKLIDIRVATKSYRKVWGCGLSTAEIEWQVYMHETYGNDDLKWPRSEVEKRDREREAEKEADPNANKPSEVRPVPPGLAYLLNEQSPPDWLLEQAKKPLTLKMEPLVFEDVPGEPLKKTATLGKRRKPAK